ncbi:FecCD family ABC transporter permease [Beggiatoa leptomitoformis]|uniref:Iron chelate uptake ABC transporter family permease subunit n=1 Tax=Beggiatoa leptomitoformis TaxID=288004 RepID=A0A2N9YEA0_9GAMM|nr:iron ABC transporter permease [Beggiatoa leptomitoformis]ALG68839.1 iron chelate uptake ABC transporter family permease subunit [Beggiatoa leptomitoformis]AUI68794.1 iron chelate uptake ABC transporter family permease subunit [Beggiatoa leptomitoformis]
MNNFLIILILVLVLLLTALFSLTVGRFALSLADISHVFLYHWLPDEKLLSAENFALYDNILFNIRLPRIIAAMLIGAALAVSGTAFQAIFVNPLVSPDILGALAGASFGAALGIITTDSWFMVQFSAFGCGILAVAVALFIARIFPEAPLLMLILGGIISGSLFTALLSIVKFLADPYNQLPAIVYWLMGSLASIDKSTVYWLSFPMLTAIIGLLSLGRHLNILSMGDDEARSLGINVSRIRLWTILMATLLSALTVVMAGMIGWVGLIIPHITRLLVGHDNRILLPASALVGALFLLLVDNLSRTVFTAEIPLGIITSLVGIIVFIVVLRSTRQGWT